MLASYLRLHLPVHAPDIAVVRAAVQLLHPSVRRERGLRESRKRFYRDMLRHHAEAQRLLAQFRL